MAQDTVDTAIFPVAPVNPKKPLKKIPSIEALNSEMPGKDMQKDRGKRAFKSLINRLRLKKYASVTISRPDPSYRVAYLGNVVTGWARGEGCVEKPLATLWRNYTQSSRPDVRMQLTVSGGGLKATTKDHGLTEYWAHRLTTCAAPKQFPKLFCWVYRHEGRRLRHELRCHAVLCPSAAVAQQIETELKNSLALALAEFKRDKICKQNARLSLVNSVYENPTIPRRKILLSTGSQNYRPPLERSKSAPKLTSIEEIIDEEDIFGRSKQIYKKILKHYDTSSSLLDKRRQYIRTKLRDLEKTTEANDNHDSAVTNDSRNGKADERTSISEEDDRDFRSNKAVTFEGNLHDHHNDLATLAADNEKTSDMILDELVQSSMSNDLLESCERAWYNALGEKPDLIPVDSDEGSLSSGCESSTSTALSDIDQPPVFPTINEEHSQPQLSHSVDTKEQQRCNFNATRKTDLNNSLDFKLGGSVLSRVRSIERITNNSSCSDIFKYNNHNSCNVLGHEEVSLVPVGESPNDFSSLKVFKKRGGCNGEGVVGSSSNNCNNNSFNNNHVFVYSGSSDIVDSGSFMGDCSRRNQECEEEQKSECSDESGYEEELASVIGNIVLV